MSTRRHGFRIISSCSLIKDQGLYKNNLTTFKYSFDLRRNDDMGLKSDEKMEK